MISFPQIRPGPMDLDRYRAILGPDADGLSDEQLAAQLEADRALARALCTLISTDSAGSAKRVAS